MITEVGPGRIIGLRPGEELTVVALSSTVQAETPTDPTTTKRLRRFVQRNSRGILFLLGERADDETDLFVGSGKEIESLARRKRRLRIPDREFVKEIARALEQGGAQFEIAQEAAEALVKKVINKVAENLPTQARTKNQGGAGGGRGGAGGG